MPGPVLQNALWANDAGYRGTDIHLVRPVTGSITSVSLLQYLRLQFDSGLLQPAPAGATVTFAANVPNPARFGFSVASADGKVTNRPRTAVSTTGPRGRRGPASRSPSRRTRT